MFNTVFSLTLNIHQSVCNIQLRRQHKVIKPIKLKIHNIESYIFQINLGKSFAFVEFSTHAAAKSVVEASVRRGIMVQGRTISIGTYADVLIVSKF